MKKVFDFIVSLCSNKNSKEGHDKELLQMAQNDMTLKQIEAHFGINDNTIFYHVYKLGGADA